MNNKIKTLIIMGIAIGGIRAARANPLQINEARQELSRIRSSKQEASITLQKAKLAYNALRTAEAKQAKALNLLIKSDQAKQLAEKNSIQSVENGKNASAYYADQGHNSGTATLLAQPKYEYERELPAYLQGS